ncbi:MAG: hypothetical protein ABSC94_20050 [Polyangiaceae bacterium]|jgi:hypothetical protein
MRIGTNGFSLRALCLVAFATAACAPGAKNPTTTRVSLAPAFAHAFRVDATGPASDAVDAYLELVRLAARSPEDPWQVPALEAALDALAEREMPALGDASRDAALAYRTRDAGAITDGLSRASIEARGPFAKALIARALESLAESRADASQAERHRSATGCARDALVVGPTTWTPITGIDEPDPLDDANATIAAAYPSSGAFGQAVHPTAVQSRGCGIDLAVESPRPGVRDVIVDVSVPRAQKIGIVLRAHGAAVLRAGGSVVLSRPFEAGDGEAARFARVYAARGTLRLVARVGTARQDDSLEIDALGEDGGPLSMTAPAIGSAAHERIQGVELVARMAPASDDEALLAAAAFMAAGDAPSAERLLWSSSMRPDSRPDAELVYGRALQEARDLSAPTRAERARSAYERVLASWPTSWEATIAHAVLAGVRRGRDEAGIESLRDIAELRAKPQSSSAPIVDAFEALTAGRERLFDRATAALERARPGLEGTVVFADASDAVAPRVGPERSAAACDLHRPIAHDTFRCFDALRAQGDHPAAMRELARIRALLGAPTSFLRTECIEALVAGDEMSARRAFAAMPPAERTLAILSLVDDSVGGPGAERGRLLALAMTARDAPAALSPLLRAVGDNPGAALDGEADHLAALDRAQPILPSAGTALLAHRELYEVLPDGLTHWLLFDVRRLSGTTDVEENAQAAAPDLWGHAAAHALRRRILKKDGRVLEPDRTPHASQAHADLSQLEQGDIIEAVYEGWSLPSDAGDIGIDTPDLLPARTAVHGATIELRLPRAVRGAIWSHAILGSASERAEGDTRILTWNITDHGVRRIEDGVPKMDRNVGVSFSTIAWTGIARALRETLAALDEQDPEIGSWARESVANAPKGPAAAVDAIVIAAGKALREADAGTLSDYGGGIAPVQTQTARTFLASHDGSRSWLILRGLRELGIPSDLVVAENEPYSADPLFPPHYGRFSHPLVVAHVPGAAGTSDVWIDADTAGPPLPAGRVSPELRGRLALHSDGSIAPLPDIESHSDERDEIDLRLSLDSDGNARGTFAIVLRGRDAQELAEALLRIVGAERQHALREVVLAWLPWANVDEVELASSDGSWQVSLRADVSVSGYAQQEGKTWLLPGIDALHWAWPKARVSSLAATLAARAGRESALAVGSAVQYHVHRRVELPQGAVITRMPGPLEIKAKLVEASRKMSVDKRAIEDDFVLGVATGTVAPGDYDAFVRTAHRADDGFLACARVRVP